jgi:hypothetical protein
MSGRTDGEGGIHSSGSGDDEPANSVVVADGDTGEDAKSELIMARILVMVGVTAAYSFFSSRGDTGEVVVAAGKVATTGRARADDGTVDEGALL